MSKTKPPRKLPFWATLLTLLGLCILCGLGTWQLQRLAWKNDLIANLNAAYNQQHPANLDLSQNPPEFTYGRITGTFLADKAFLLGPPRMQDETPGYDLIVPIRAGEQTLLVNMGWTPHPLDKQPIYHLQGRSVAFYGLLRMHGWNAFTPQNQPDKNIWFRLITGEIAAAKAIDNLYPAYLRADRANYKFDAVFFGDSAQNRPMPNNNHLQYALFWFAMAAALLSVYTLRFVKRKS